MTKRDLVDEVKIYLIVLSSFIVIFAFVFAPMEFWISIGAWATLAINGVPTRWKLGLLAAITMHVLLVGWIIIFWAIYVIVYLVDNSKNGKGVR